MNLHLKHHGRRRGGELASGMCEASGLRFPERCFRQAAFSLIEILVVIGLLSIIILGLLLMFNQTQRAFRTGLTDVDVQEGGRAAQEMIARELAQMTALNRSNVVNFYTSLPGFAPLMQPLPGATGVSRTNLLEEMFFLARENQTWSGIAYLVAPPADGVGTLYRFYATNAFGKDPSLLFSTYLNTPLTNMNRVVDGIVHFKVRAFDTNGVWLTPDHDLLGNTNDSRAQIAWSPNARYEVGLYKFFSNAIPASVEFELGILEPRALERFRSIPDSTARRQYLQNQAGRVHLFRMRVPIRNVDPTAYQ